MEQWEEEIQKAISEYIKLQSQSTQDKAWELVAQAYENKYPPHKVLTYGMILARLPWYRGFERGKPENNFRLSMSPGIDRLRDLIDSLGIGKGIITPKVAPLPIEEADKILEDSNKYFSSIAEKFLGKNESRGDYANQANQFNRKN